MTRFATNHPGWRGAAAAAAFLAVAFAAFAPTSRAPAASAAPALPALPGATGFGTATPGGRGGAVVRVTTLADDGPGSLRAALEGRDDPRIVVFAVDGAIALMREVAVGANATVLGQTAPGGGITITGARLAVVGDDVILRGLRVRPGLGPGQPFQGRDGISVGAKGRVVARVVVAQNSVAWGTDENLATWHEVEDVTFQRNLIAEALNEAGHPQGAHSMGLLVGRTARRVSVVENVLVSNRWRNPQFKGLSEGEFVNNVVHNYGPGGLAAMDGPMDGPIRLDVVGNLFSAGPDTPDPGTRAPILLQGADPASRYCVRGNVTPMGADRVRGAGRVRLSECPVVGRSADGALAAEALLPVLLGRVGARLPALDAVDRRFLREIVTDGGKVVDAPPPIGPAAQGAIVAERADRDGDGIPDAWEVEIGSDPDRADAGVLSPTGYAFVEDYVNAANP